MPGFVDEGRAVAIVNFDFSKAFDTVSSKILIEKLMKYELGIIVLLMLVNKTNIPVKQELVCHWHGLTHTVHHDNITCRVYGWKALKMIESCKLTPVCPVHECPVRQWRMEGKTDLFVLALPFYSDHVAFVSFYSAQWKLEGLGHFTRSTTAWDPSHGRQSSMNFSKLSPSHEPQFFINCSSMGSPQGHMSCQQSCSSLHGSTGPARSLLQRRLPMRSQSPLGIHLLRQGVLHRLQVDICMDLHGLHHGLQGNLCSGAWSTSSPSFFTDLGRHLERRAPVQSVLLYY
ncbi:hypothetical protein QYF61_003495 [Mycteria americana]|uniref:Reverse transcriptase domain-containing protein n=1 Tax=Mycteria americana TaxID=33587 RepID=A0AAN7PBB0_MYCAM|nr:hypothetical protein QYF61_003495 [Mycteria americana]